MRGDHGVLVLTRPEIVREIHDQYMEAGEGWYFSHPRARCFSIGKVEKDQVEDYACRKGIPVAEAKKCLPSLAYKPEHRKAADGE